MPLVEAFRTLANSMLPLHQKGRKEQKERVEAFRMREVLKVRIVLLVVRVSLVPVVRVLLLEQAQVQISVPLEQEAAGFQQKHWGRVSLVPVLPQIRSMHL